MSTSILDGVRGAPKVRSALAALTDLHQRTAPRPLHAVLRTGLDPLDEVLGGGVRPGELLLLGGKPGVGKTIACLQAARAMAQQGVAVVYLCYEHDDATLVTRLLSCELGELLAAEPAAVAGGELRRRLRDVAAGAVTLAEVVASDPLLDKARTRVAAYADRIAFVTGSGAHTNVTAISEVSRHYTGQPVALFVDYVQKVPVHPAIPVEAERVGHVIESLKELALDQQLVVVAVAAAGQDGLEARRLHLHHFRGSTALAYEADAIVVLNDKLDVVSRAHFVNSPTRAEEFRRHVVFSVEKNRNGTPDVNVEFEKDFAHYRFHPRGRWVAERLWTEGSVEQ